MSSPRSTVCYSTGFSVLKNHLPLSVSSTQSAGPALIAASHLTTVPLQVFGPRTTGVSDISVGQVYSRA